LHELFPELSVVDVVATAQLGQTVDLDRLIVVNGFTYDRAIYHCAYFKDEKTTGKIVIFGTGNMISVGAKSYEAARQDLHYACTRLAELGLISEIGSAPSFRTLSRLQTSARELT